MATTDLTNPTELSAVQAALAGGNGLTAAKLVGSAAAQVRTVVATQLPDTAALSLAADGLQRAYMEGIVKNPLSYAYQANHPVNLSAEFEMGRVPSADYLTLTVQGGTGNRPFQWEGATDPWTEVDVSKWLDGSLRAGNIWFLLPASLEAGGSRRVTLQINDVPQGQVFTPNVVYEVVTAGSVERFTAGNPALQKYDFEAAQGWNNRRIRDQSFPEDYFESSNGVFAQTATAGVIKNSFTVSDITLVSKGERDTSKLGFGGGVVFRDWETVWTWAAEPNQQSRVRYRVWADGTVNVQQQGATTAALASNSRRLLLGVMHQTINSPVVTADAENAFYTISYSGTYPKRIMVGLIASLTQYEAMPQGSATTSVAQGTTSTYGWTATTGAPSGAYWTQEIFISPRYPNGAGTGAETGEWLRRRNPLAARLSRKSLKELKGDFARLAVAWAAKYDEWYPQQADTQWLGCQAVAKLFYGKAAGVDVFDQAVALWEQWLAARGGPGLDGTAAKYLAMWNDPSGIGLEYIGRNAMALGWLYDEAARTGRDTARWTTLIHNIADFIVQAEIVSGGAGKVGLYGPNGAIASQGDNWNAEATAIGHLARSLALAPDATRFATLGRIWARFQTGYEAANFMAYKATDLGARKATLTEPTFHYFCFGLFEVLAAMKHYPAGFTALGMDPRVFIYKNVTVLGQMRDKTNQYLPERRGVFGSWLYAAATLAMLPDATISDMEQAISLLRHVGRRAKPLGFAESPVDGGGYTSGNLFQAMDVRVLAEATST